MSSALTARPRWLLFYQVTYFPTMSIITILVSLPAIIRNSCNERKETLADLHREIQPHQEETDE